MARTPLKIPADTIYVLNGPSLDPLGTRGPETRGPADLADVAKTLRRSGREIRPENRLPPIQRRN